MRWGVEQVVEIAITAPDRVLALAWSHVVPSVGTAARG